MTDATGRLMTLVAYDSDGLPHPLLIDADGNLLVSNQGGASGGSLKTPSGKLFTPVANDPDDVPRPFLVDTDGYLKVKGLGGRVKIYDNTRTTTGNWAITSIPQGYDNLEMVIMARSDRDSTVDQVNCFFNEDEVNANYYYAMHYAGTGHAVSEGSNAWIANITALTALADRAGVSKVLIPSYTLEVFTKMARCWAGLMRAVDSIYMYDYFMCWNSKNPITRIDIKPNGGTGFIAGSRLIVYGTY